MQLSSPVTKVCLCVCVFVYMRSASVLPCLNSRLRVWVDVCVMVCRMKLIEHSWLVSHHRTISSQFSSQLCMGCHVASRSAQTRAQSSRSQAVQNNQGDAVSNGMCLLLLLPLLTNCCCCCCCCGYLRWLRSQLNRNFYYAALWFSLLPRT